MSKTRLSPSQIKALKLGHEKGTFTAQDLPIKGAAGKKVIDRKATWVMWQGEALSLYTGTGASPGMSTSRGSFVALGIWDAGPKNGKSRVCSGIH